MNGSRPPHYSELEGELLRSAALDVPPAGLHDRLDAALLVGVAAAAAAGAAGATSGTAMAPASAAVAHAGMAAPAAAGSAVAASSGAAAAGVALSALKWVAIAAVGGALSMGVLKRVATQGPATTNATSVREGTSPATPTPLPTVIAHPNATADTTATSNAATATNANPTSMPTSNATPPLAGTRSTPTAAVSPSFSSPQAGDELPRELQRIDEARAELVAGDSARLIERLDRYDLEFPSPHLAAEALALRIEAYALRHDHERVGALARMFLSRYPQHPLAARVKLLASVPR